MTLKLFKNMIKSESDNPEELLCLVEEAFNNGVIDKLKLAQIKSDINIQYKPVKASNNISSKNYFSTQILNQERNIMTASNYIDSNYTYIAIFTNFDKQQDVEIHRRNLNRDNTEGYSGNWVIDKNKIFQKVLLYVRENGQNKIYLADYLDREMIVEPNGKIRWRVHFKHLKLVDTTSLHWGDFMESKSSQNPIRYIEKT